MLFDEDVYRPRLGHIGVDRVTYPLRLEEIRHDDMMHLSPAGGQFPLHSLQTAFVAAQQCDGRPGLGQLQRPRPGRCLDSIRPPGRVFPTGRYSLSLPEEIGCLPGLVSVIVTETASRLLAFSCPAAKEGSP